MCCKRIRSCCIFNLRHRKDLLAEILAEIFGSSEINLLTAKNVREFPFHPGDSKQTGHPTVFELYQHINIALRSKIIPENGAE